MKKYHLDKRFLTNVSRYSINELKSPSINPVYNNKIYLWIVMQLSVIYSFRLFWISLRNGTNRTPCHFRISFRFLPRFFPLPLFQESLRYTGQTQWIPKKKKKLRNTAPWEYSRRISTVLFLWSRVRLGFSNTNYPMGSSSLRVRSTRVFITKRVNEFCGRKVREKESGGKIFRHGVRWLGS